MAERKLVFIQPDGPQGATVKLGIQNGDVEKLKEALSKKPVKEQKKAETIRQIATELGIPLADH